MWLQEEGEKVTKGAGSGGLEMRYKELVVPRVKKKKEKEVVTASGVCAGKSNAASNR